MNTVEEILKSKNSFKRYIEEICPECSNKNTNLCYITRAIDNTLKCNNYSRCITTKCKECDKEKECFKSEKSNNST